MALLVTEAEDNLQLLSAAELRVAAGLASDDTSQDAALATQGLRAAAALASACGVARAGYSDDVGEAPRTLKLETLSQTFRVKHNNQTDTLFLARWPVGEIVSVTAGSTLLTSDDYEVDVPEAALIRVSGDSTLYWPAGRITVEYSAGYETIPADLKSYASRLVSLYYQNDGEDPNEKSVDIPGVIKIDRWVDTATDSIVPDDIIAGLTRDGFRKPVLA
jgi:hypothetical protein